MKFYQIEAFTGCTDCICGCFENIADVRMLLLELYDFVIDFNNIFHDWLRVVPLFIWNVFPGIIFDWLAVECVVLLALSALFLNPVIDVCFDFRFLLLSHTVLSKCWQFSFDADEFSAFDDVDALAFVFVVDEFSFDVCADVFDAEVVSFDALVFDADELVFDALDRTFFIR